MPQISYSELKQRVSIVQVFTKLINRDITEEPRNGQIRISCPRCESSNKSLSINTEKNLFKCFRCEHELGTPYQGNILDAVATYNKITPRKAAEKITAWFPAEDREVQKPTETTHTRNKPLGFALKGIDPTHESVVSLFYSNDVIETFGIGYYKGRSFPNGSLVAPLKNRGSEIVGYLGFTSEGETTYPEKFHTDQTLFGENQLDATDTGELLITQNPSDVFVLQSQAHMTAVATMQNIPSDYHIKILTEMTYSRYTYLYTEQQSDEELGAI